MSKICHPCIQKLKPRRARSEKNERRHQIADNLTPEQLQYQFKPAMEAAIAKTLKEINGEEEITAKLENKNNKARKRKHTQAGNDQE